MEDPNMQFDPVTGWNDGNVFPDNPSDVQVRGLFQKLHDQTRDFINNTLIPWISAKFATNDALGQVIAGQVNIVDPVTGKKYVYVVVDGNPGIKEVQ